MPIVVRRKNQTQGGSSQYLNIPKPIKAGKESTIVVDRLLLADPKGKISTKKLEEFFEEKVQPAFYRWKENQRNGE